MNKILNWFKFWETKEQPYVKPQKFVDLKRTNSIVSFIHPGHPCMTTSRPKKKTGSAFWLRTKPLTAKTA